jgi:hypothetical protein
MRSFLITLITLFIVSCSTGNFVQGPSSIIEVYNNEYFTTSQIDSMIKSDTLPTIGMWMDLSLKDYETSELIAKKFYVKRTSVYIAHLKKDSIFITKRIGK